MSSVPQGAIGKTRKQREITMIDRPQAKRQAFNQGAAQQKAAIAARKAPASKPAAPQRFKASMPPGSVANATGQRKQLTKFNSRPERTRGAFQGNRYIDKEKLTGRQPVDLSRGDDRAYARGMTKTVRIRNQSRRADRAEANIPMAGARGKRLDAEITRNVKAQKAQARMADKARNVQFKSDQSRAKKLREVHVPGIAKAKGLSTAQVAGALKAQPPSVQVKALKNWVKQNRATAKRK
jgi:hypothetical protein